MKLVDFFLELYLAPRILFFHVNQQSYWTSIYTKMLHWKIYVTFDEHLNYIRLQYGLVAPVLVICDSHILHSLRTHESSCFTSIWNNKSIKALISLIQDFKCLTIFGYFAYTLLTLDIKFKSSKETHAGKRIIKVISETSGPHGFNVQYWKWFMTIWSGINQWRTASLLHLVTVWWQSWRLAGPARRASWHRQRHPATDSLCFSSQPH